MQTVFGLFQQYDDASTAVDELLHKRFDAHELNAVVQDYVVKGRRNMRRANVEVTEEATSLDQLLGGEQAVNIPDVGGVYAAGDLATLLTRTAAIQGAAGAGLKEALKDFSIPEDVADTFTAGITGGGVLVCVRTQDERAAEAAQILRSSKGAHVASYAQ